MGLLFYIKNLLTGERSFLWLSLCILLVTPPLMLKASSVPVNFNTITVVDGLSSNLIHSIYKDSKGFIWLGTSSGLNRYDGINVKKYDVFDSESISIITELDEDTLLLGMEPGLIKFDRKTNRAVSVQLDTKAVIVRSIYVIDNTHYLVGTEQGLYYVAEGEVKKIILDNNVSLTNFVSSIMPENNSVFWLTTQNGLCRYDLDKDETTFYKKPGVNYLTSITCIDSTIYVGSFNAGVFSFSQKTRKFEQLPFTKDLYIKCISSDKDGNLYIGTDGKGLKIWSPRTNELSSVNYNPDDPYSISASTILSFLLDGNIFWIGTNIGGLSYNPLERKIFESYSYKAFKSTSTNIRSFLISEDQTKLIGTRNGLVYISEKDNIVKKYMEENISSGLRSNIITYIFKYNDDFLIGSYGGGLYVFNPKDLLLSDFSKDNVFIHGSIFWLLTDKDNNLWIATNEGLFCYDRDYNLLRKYNVTNSGLPNNTILNIVCDSNNCLWINTLNNGVCLLDINTGIIKSDLLPKEYDLALKKVNYLYEDSKRNIWICSTRGLLHVDQSFAVKYYTSENVLPDNFVKGIIEDNSGNYWISTMRGVVRFDQKSNNHDNYDISNGLFGYNFNNVIQKTNDGRIWWSNDRGLFYCDPQNIKGNIESTASSIPVITAIYVNSQDTEKNKDFINISSEYIKEIVLPRDKNNIGLRFSLLSYSLPQHTEYEYMLDGYDDEWQRSNKNEAYYFNLKSGNYTFRLRHPGNHKSEAVLLIHIKSNYSWVIWISLFLLGFSGLSVFYYKKLRTRGSKGEDVGSRRNSKERQLTVSEDAAQIIAEKLANEMQANKIYLNPDLKANDVAVLLNCSLAELSQVLNMYLNTSFTDFINKYRFEEFNSYLNKELLSKYTLNGISEKCGFNSRSTFYRTVKKATGKSPAEYVESLGLPFSKK